LLDIGIYEGKRSIDYIQTTPIYTYTDPYLHYEKQYVMAKDSTVQLYHFVNDKIYSPAKQNLLVFYDHSTNFL